MAEGEVNLELLATLIRRLDAKVGRVESTVTDIAGRMQRVEAKLTSIDHRVQALEGFDGQIAPIDRRLDELHRHLSRIEYAEPLPDA